MKKIKKLIVYIAILSFFLYFSYGENFKVKDLQIENEKKINIIFNKNIANSPINLTILSGSKILGIEGINFELNSDKIEIFFYDPLTIDNEYTLFINKILSIDGEKINESPKNSSGTIIKLKNNFGNFDLNNGKFYYSDEKIKKIYKGLKTGKINENLLYDENYDLETILNNIELTYDELHENDNQENSDEENLIDNYGTVKNNNNQTKTDNIFFSGSSFENLKSTGDNSNIFLTGNLGSGEILAQEEKNEQSKVNQENKIETKNQDSFEQNSGDISILNKIKFLDFKNLYLILTNIYLIIGFGLLFIVVISYIIYIKFFKIK